VLKKAPPVVAPTPAPAPAPAPTPTLAPAPTPTTATATAAALDAPLSDGSANMMDRRISESASD
jgi:hypothetical protein